MKYILFGLLIVIDVIVSYPSRSQEHLHGVTVPDWYDQDCCNLNDCRPVEDKDVNFEDQFGKPVAIYNSDKFRLTYERSRWRNSKDERYHACFRGETVYCIYIPIGV